MQPLLDLPTLHALGDNARRQRPLRGTAHELDLHPVVKLFTPDASCTWLLTELDPADQDTAFGLCDLGLGSPELGYVSLREIIHLRGRMGLPVERDLHWNATMPLSVYARVARKLGYLLV
ncbi:DUF2958 domain-containing protein [Phenylobacterium ferrooxidans]|uniref:DUF2958 domain-containing protein n=1 Tax=Phenylobacterium ferrooxidans TaxID=2982689 RepID=A0ABW6CUV1_9CAUL